MKKYFISFGLLLVAIFFSVIVFNEIHAWAGIFCILASLGIFLNYIYKQLKKNYDEKKV
jgi:hypothetical protein